MNKDVIRMMLFKGFSRCVFSAGGHILRIAPGKTYSQGLTLLESRACKPKAKVWASTFWNVPVWSLSQPRVKCSVETMSQPSPRRKMLASYISADHKYVTYSTFQINISTITLFFYHIYRNLAGICIPTTTGPPAWTFVSNVLVSFPAALSKNHI